MPDAPHERCIHCEDMAVRARNEARRTIPYRTMPAMELPVALQIPSWSVSDESWLLQRTTERKRSR